MHTLAPSTHAPFTPTCMHHIAITAFGYHLDLRSLTLPTRLHAHPRTYAHAPTRPRTIYLHACMHSDVHASQTTRLSTPSPSNYTWRLHTVHMHHFQVLALFHGAQVLNAAAVRLRRRKLLRHRHEGARVQPAIILINIAGLWSPQHAPRTDHTT